MGILQNMNGAAFGDRLRALRQDAGLSQQELADRIGMKRTNLVKIETGKIVTPTPETQERLADGLGLSYAEFGRRMRAVCRQVASVDTGLEPERAELLDKLDRVALDDETRVSTLRTVLDLWLGQDRHAEAEIEDGVVRGGHLR